MSESVQEDLPITHPDDRVELLLSNEQRLALRRAAELLGWTVEQYVLATALDRAERDLNEQATHQHERRPVRGVNNTPSDTENAPVEPFIAVVTAIS